MFSSPPFTYKIHICHIYVSVFIQPVVGYIGKISKMAPIFGQNHTFQLAIYGPQF